MRRNPIRTRCEAERSRHRTQLNNDLKSVPMMARIFSYSGQSAKISLKFTDKEPIFADLSVSKTYFTDKQSFSAICP